MVKQFYFSCREGDDRRTASKAQALCRPLAQGTTQFSVSKLNCLCGLGKQSGRVATMAPIRTGEISGSAGLAYVIKY